MGGLKKLWNCWVAERTHRKPYWKAWARLLVQTPPLADYVEEEPYYSIYKKLGESGKYRVEPQPRGKWVGNNWVMRPMI